MKSPRRRNLEKTRAQILLAAQEAFSEIGYAHAGIRHIAAKAGADSALIQRYFGSKAGLFEAALSDAIPTIDDPDLTLANFGSRLTAESLAGFFDLRAQSMIILSVGDPEARLICARVLKMHAIDPLAQALAVPDGETRAIRMIMLLTGFMLFTRQVQLATPGQAEEDGTSKWIAALVQEIISDPGTVGSRR